jgi:hypothetical protein
MDILSFILDHQPRLKKLCKPLTKQFSHALKNNPEFSDDIYSQYETECKKIFLDEITKNLACSTEDAMIILEQFDVEGFLE